MCLNRIKQADTYEGQRVIIAERPDDNIASVDDFGVAHLYYFGTVEKVNNGFGQYTVRRDTGDVVVLRAGEFEPEHSQGKATAVEKTIAGVAIAIAIILAVGALTHG